MYGKNKPAPDVQDRVQGNQLLERLEKTAAQFGMSAKELMSFYQEQDPRYQKELMELLESEAEVAE